MKLDTLPDEVLKEILLLTEAKKKLEVREKATNSFMTFAHHVYENFIEGEHHRIIAEKLERVARGELKRLIINMPPRHRLLLETPVPTVGGWKTVETVRVGDFVFAPDGSPVAVTGKSDVYEEDLYEVVTSDGQVVVCDGEHLWTVRFGSGRPYETLSTAEILHKLETETWRKFGNFPMLPPQGPAAYPYRDLPIDPYVLGVWLGDGSSYGASIGCSYKDMPQMRQQVETCGYRTTHNPKFQQFNVLGLYAKLREAGLLKNKHIPEEYLCSSVEQRIALLQGLIDTDGDVTKHGKVTFNQTNLGLTEQVLCLIHSLGIKARITERQTSYNGVPSQTSYRICFKFGRAARLPRKAKRCRDLAGNWGRSIDVRRTARRGKVRCLEVANEDGLFLAGKGFVVTHNSKSEFASFLMPAWFLGRNPKLKIIQATHNTELAVRFGRKVRDLIDDPAYKEIFPSTNLKEDNKGAGKWGTDKGGEYFAAGVGAAVTGRGADLFIIDDPHSEQDAMSETAFDHAYEWYTSGPRQRLQPGGAIILVMCMTGDTPVLMANGTEKPLRDIRPGDIVATYENGQLSIATINNWQSSGVDSVFKVQTQSGRILRANERHPFLVSEEGAVKWIKLRDLKPGMQLVSLKDAADHLGQKQSPDFVKLARAEKFTTGKIQTPLAGRSGITESGSVLSAQTLVVQARRLQRACADLATKSNTKKEERLKLPARIALNIAMESLLSSTRQWFSSETIDAMFAVMSPQPQTLARIGAANCALTTVTPREKSAGSSATTVTLPSGTVRTLQFFGRRRSISSFTTDAIVSVIPDGEEEVFDVEVDRTENFIANGIVSHNTRWGKKDLTGRLLAAQSSDAMADQWEVVEFPAILPSGRPLWPEFWEKDALLSIKASLPLGKWAAQWQQQPTSEGSAIIRKEWWRKWEKEKIPPLKYIIQAYDTAFSRKETADYSAITTWGIFEPEEGTRDNIILLDAQRGRWSFPELKEVAFEEHAYWEPDMVIVEAKASGRPLIDELRSRGIPALGFSPGRRAGGGGVDKTTRMHMVSPLFEAGLVWAPGDKKFSEEVIEEVTSFPNGEHDDFCDSMTLALIRFRQGGFVTIHDEERLDFADQVPRKREYY